MKRIFLACAVLLAACAPAEASFLLRLDSKGAGRSGRVTFNDGQGTSGSIAGVFIGQLNMTFDVGGQNQAFNTFCIDLGHRVTLGQTYSVNVRDLGPPPGFTDFAYGGGMAYLYNQFGTAAFATTNAGKDQAAGLQLALWRLSMGPTGSFSVSGVSAAVMTAFNSFYSLGMNNSAIGRWLDASASGSGLHRGQSMIYPPAPPQGPPAVPAPGGLVLAASGGLAFLASMSGRVRAAVRRRAA